MTAPQRRRRDGTRTTARQGRAERQRELLECARQLFARHGYAATTSAMIAEAAGITEGALGRRFKSKTSLFLEVVREVHEAVLGQCRAAMAELADPLAKLHAVLEVYLGATRDTAQGLQLLHRTLLETDDEEIGTGLRALHLESESFLANLIHEGQQSGVFRRSLDPRVGAWELICSALGHALTLPLKVPLHEEPDYRQRAIDCMLHCLLKTDV
jgi:AcrR family transcriptional regulator